MQYNIVYAVQQSVVAYSRVPHVNTIVFFSFICCLFLECTPQLYLYFPPRASSLEEKLYRASSNRKKMTLRTNIYSKFIASKSHFSSIWSTVGEAVKKWLFDWSNTKPK